MGNNDLMAGLPPITEPSKSADLAERARRDVPTTDGHSTVTQVFSYLELLRDRYDSPLHVGVTGRAAILLSLSGRLRKNLKGLDKKIQRSGGRLFLEGLRLGRHGMLRSVLELPEYDLIFETPLTLAHGDVREFLSAAYEHEAIELHLTHVTDPRPMRFVCQGAAIRPVVAAAVDAVRGLDHPTTLAEQAGPVREMEARFPTTSDGLTDQVRIPLTVTGSADDVVTVLTVN
jgi:hypothetical protein